MYTSTNYTLETCSVAISTSVSIFITWAQIGAALDALINVCIANPTKPSTGGRAYYGTEGLSVVGRKNKRGSVNGKFYL